MYGFIVIVEVRHILRMEEQWMVILFSSISCSSVKIVEKRSSGDFPLIKKEEDYGRYHSK